MLRPARDVGDARRSGLCLCELASSRTTHAVCGTSAAAQHGLRGAGGIDVLMVSEERVPNTPPVVSGNKLWTTRCYHTHAHMHY